MRGDHGGSYDYSVGDDYSSGYIYQLGYELQISMVDDDEVRLRESNLVVLV